MALLCNTVMCIDVLSAIQIMLYMFRCIDVTLYIRYILWDVYHMLAERQIVVPL
jgi:hypothetical protein